MPVTDMRKQVYLPVTGDMLTDGKRLVEVIGKCREGYTIVDASQPDTRDPRAIEVIPTDKAVKDWRKVEFDVLDLGDFDDAA